MKQKLVFSAVHPPNDVGVNVATPDENGAKLEVTWTEQECQQEEARIKSYEIAYCLAADDDTCTGIETLLQVFVLYLGSVTLTDLL